MAKEFSLSISTPGSALFDSLVSEALIPSYDGECGVLAEHEDFVGLLGTGALKLVKEGNDHWFMVSSGIFQVENGRVTILAEIAEPAAEIEIESAKQLSEKLEPMMVDKNTLTEDYESMHLEYSRAKARQEVYRRTNLVN